MIEKVRAGEVCDPSLREAAISARGYWDPRFGNPRDLETVHEEMPDPTMVDIGDRMAKAVILEPDNPDYDETLTVVRFSEHQQPYQAMQYIGAKVMQQMVAPDSRLVMITRDAYKFNDKELGALRSGDASPIGQVEMRILEELGLDRVILTGYSLGGISVASVAAAGSDSVEVIHQNMDEPPSKTGRTTKELKKDFMASGTWSDQRAAMQDADITPVSDDLRFAPRLLWDYTKFGIGSLRPANKALLSAMSGSISDLLNKAEASYPDSAQKIGYIYGSKMLDPNSVLDTSAEVFEYGVLGFHRHASVNNPFMQAALLDHGLKNTGHR